MIINYAIYETYGRTKTDNSWKKKRGEKIVDHDFCSALIDIFRCEKAVKTTNDEYLSSRWPWNIYDAR